MKIASFKFHFNPFFTVDLKSSKQTSEVLQVVVWKDVGWLQTGKGNKSDRTSIQEGVYSNLALHPEDKNHDTGVGGWGKEDGKKGDHK